MDYVFTQHARDALRKRNIDESWVEAVIVNPEVVEPDTIDPELEHRLARIPSYGDRVLRAILNVRKSPVHVVTVFFDRRRSL